MTEDLAVTGRWTGRVWVVTHQERHSDLLKDQVHGVCRVALCMEIDKWAAQGTKLLGGVQDLDPLPFDGVVDEDGPKDY